MLTPNTMYQWDKLRNLKTHSNCITSERGIITYCKTSIQYARHWKEPDLLFRLTSIYNRLQAKYVNQVGIIVLDTFSFYSGNKYSLYGFQIVDRRKQTVRDKNGKHWSLGITASKKCNGKSKYSLRVASSRAQKRFRYRGNDDPFSSSDWFSTYGYGFKLTSSASNVIWGQCCENYKPSFNPISRWHRDEFNTFRLYHTNINWHSFRMRDYNYTLSSLIGFKITKVYGAMQRILGHILDTFKRQGYNQHRLGDYDDKSTEGFRITSDWSIMKTAYVQNHNKRYAEGTDVKKYKHTLYGFRIIHGGDR